MAIKFYDYSFAGPFPITNWKPPGVAAVYVVLIPNPAAKPQPFSPIYFGESENLSEPSFYLSHHRYDCWLEQGGSEKGLYIAIYKMPGSTQGVRRSVALTLISKYQTVCNI